MVPFAGYELPVLYKGSANGGVMKEHLWCRSDGKASLFDVSHMGQVSCCATIVCASRKTDGGVHNDQLYMRYMATIVTMWMRRNLILYADTFCLTLALPKQIRWHGKDRAAFLEKIVVGDIAGLAPGSGCLSLVTNSAGGIIDDTVITNAGDYVYMVVNGATKFGDMEHFREQMAQFDGDVTMEYLEDSMQLLAIQGPGAAQAVSKLLPSGFDLTNMAFMTGTDTTLDGIDGCRITRYALLRRVVV